MSILLEKLIFWWQEKRKVCILALVTGALALISLLINLSFFLPESIGYSIEDELETLGLRQEELRNLMTQKRQLQIPVAILQQSPEHFWLIDQDGNPSIEFRRRIETAAQQAGMVLKSIGAVQTAKVANGATSYEVAIQANAKYDELLHFMAMLQKDGRQNCFWNVLTLNVDNTNSPNFLLINGNLKIVVVSAPEILDLWRRTP